MRKIIITALLLSGCLMAADSTQAKSAGGFATSVDGASFYKQNCANCHGDRGEKTPGQTAPLAGRDATILALTIRAYRSQTNSEIGAYTMHKTSQLMKDATVNLSDRHIGALAKYISALQ